MPPGTPRPRAETSGGCRCPPMAGRPGTVRCESPQGTTTPFTSSRRPAGPAASPAWGWQTDALRPRLCDLSARLLGHEGMTRPGGQGFARLRELHNLARRHLGPRYAPRQQDRRQLGQRGRHPQGLRDLGGNRQAGRQGSAEQGWRCPVSRERQRGTTRLAHTGRLGACGGHVIPCPGSCVRGTGRHASLCRLTPPPAGRQRLL